MLANFKGKQNTNGFANNTQNINRQGRPRDILADSIKKSLQNRDIDAGINETLQYIKKKGDKLNLREIMNISKISFARYWYLTGGDMKRYYKVFGIK